MSDDGKERQRLAGEIERRIVERSDEVRSCVREREGKGEVYLQVELLADGATRAKVTGTSISDCAEIECIRQKLTGLQIAPPLADRKDTFRWMLEIDAPGPVRLSNANAAAKWLTKSPPSSAACLDALPTGSGRLPPEVIRRIVRDQYGSFRQCYQVGLSRYRDLQGSITLRFVIEADGAVTKVSIAETTLPDCAVAFCVREAFKLLRFPAPEGGGTVTVQYPIMLQPG